MPETGDNRDVEMTFPIPSSAMRGRNVSSFPLITEYINYELPVRLCEPMTMLVEKNGAKRHTFINRSPYSTGGTAEMRCYQTPTPKGQISDALTLANPEESVAETGLTRSYLNPLKKFSKRLIQV